MLNFFYDSLDTLKKVRKPTNSEVTNLTLIIFAVVVIAALLFAFLDGIFGEVYAMIFDTLKGVFGSGAPIDAYPAYPAEVAPIDSIPLDTAPTDTAPVVDAPAVDAVVEPVIEGAVEAVEGVVE